MTHHYRVFSRTNQAWSRVMACDTAEEAIRVVAAACRAPESAFYAVPIRGTEHPDNLKPVGDVR